MKTDDGYVLTIGEMLREDDFELARWIGDHVMCSECPARKACISGESCVNSLMEYLDQPSEGVK